MFVFSLQQIHTSSINILQYTVYCIVTPAGINGKLFWLLWQDGKKRTVADNIMMMDFFFKLLMGRLNTEGWEQVGSGMGAGWERVGSMLGAGWEHVGSRFGRGLRLVWEVVASGFEACWEWVGSGLRGGFSVFGGGWERVGSGLGVD